MHNVLCELVLCRQQLAKMTITKIENRNNLYLELFMELRKYKKWDRVRIEQNEADPTGFGSSKSVLWIRNDLFRIRIQL